jgi:hypothetical protein
MFSKLVAIFGFVLFAGLATYGLLREEFGEVLLNATRVGYPIEKRYRRRRAFVNADGGLRPARVDAFLTTDRGEQQIHAGCRVSAREIVK